MWVFSFPFFSCCWIVLLCPTLTSVVSKYMWWSPLTLSSLARVSFSYCWGYMWWMMFHRKVYFCCFNFGKKSNIFFNILAAFKQCFTEWIHTIKKTYFRFTSTKTKNKQKKTPQYHRLWTKKKFIPDTYLSIASGNSPNRCPSLCTNADS